MADERLKAFLKEFDLSDSQLREVYKRFCNEINKGLNKDTHAQADTKCLVTYVHDLPTGEEIGKYLALDLGGTNFRVLLVTLKGHHEAVVSSKIYPVPQEIMRGTAVELFDHIAACLGSFVQDENVNAEKLPLGFTFSFPCEQKGLTEAILLRWTKGFKVQGVEQEDVGRLLKEAIARRGDLAIDVMAILNDTTGTLMSCAHRNPECRIGVIVGTGCNACYLENVACVDLLESNLKEKNQKVILNIEWGAFGERGALEFIRTAYDRAIDKNTLHAGQQLFEKMTSGMYLGELLRLLLIKAIEANLIFVLQQNKAALINSLSTENSIETRHISEVEADKFPEFTNTKAIIKDLFSLQKPLIEDCQKLKAICESISKRAASLIAAALAGLVNRINEPKVVIGLDGSVYRFHPKFDAYIRNSMLKLVNPKLRFDLMLSEDGSGRGAALVAAVVASQQT